MNVDTVETTDGVFQTRLDQALGLEPFSTARTSIALSDHICFGFAASGGYIAAALQKVAVSYATRHPVLKHQLDVRVSMTTFYRPVFPAKSPFTVEVHEINIGKAWSFLRIEMMHGNDSRVCAAADCNLTNFDAPGINLDTRWSLNPSPPPFTFPQNDNQEPHNWVCYHPSFHPKGFRRAQSYAKFYVPSTHNPAASYMEQWMIPGWDCFPSGSRNPSMPEARWTTELLPFVLDIGMPVSDDHYSGASGKLPPIAGTSATLNFAARQRRARVENGRADWRDLGHGVDGDGTAPNGSNAFAARKSLLCTTIMMTVEVKKKLPKEGVRWLYLRGQVKKIQSGRMDYEVLCFDQNMDLIAVKSGIEQLVDPTTKNPKVTMKVDTTKQRAKSVL